MRVRTSSVQGAPLPKRHYLGRYQVMRLVKTEVSLLPSEGFELSNRSDVPSDQGLAKETAYAIPFDLKIPGWLPQSFENDTVALSYGLITTVKLGWSDQVVQPKTVHEAGEAMDVDGIASSCPVSIVPATSQSYSSRFFPRIAKSVASALATAIPLPSSGASRQVTRASEWQVITVIRHRVPAPSCGTASLFSAETVAEQSLRHYTLRPAENSPSPVECVVSVPETIDINGPTLRVSVRLRAREGFTIAGLGEEQGQTSALSGSQQGLEASANGQTPEREAAEPSATESLTSATSVARSDSVRKDMEQIRMVELGMEVEETERYSWVVRNTHLLSTDQSCSSSPAQPFLAAYPIPEDQPSECSPHRGSSALLSPPSRLSSMSMFGLTSSKTFKATRTRTLLLGEDGKSRTYRFDGDGLELGSGWRKVNIIIPMPSAEAAATASDDINRKPASEIDTPFLRIKHKLRIRIVCRSRAMPGQDTIVVLTTPLRCGTAPERRPYSVLDESAAQVLQSSSSQVPAYCQIFHENGMAREDEEALPLYEPDSPPTYSSSLLPNRGSGERLDPVSSCLSPPSVPSPTAPTNQRLGAFAPLSAGVIDRFGTGHLPSIPGPRECRSSSSLSSISGSDQSSDEMQEETSTLGISSPEPGQSSELRHVGYFGLPAHLENRLRDMADTSSSEAILPEYLDAARRRAAFMAKHYRPSQSRLSESISNN